jgi:hypothetical protein
MPSMISEKTSSRIIAVGLATVTVAVLTQSVTDPVNVTKLFLLGGFAFAALGASFGNFSLLFLKQYRFPFLAVCFFLIASVSTLFASKAPFVQSLYGVYGRNNGFVLYLLLAFVFISALLISSQSKFPQFLIALSVAGVINVAYALWVLAFGDFIGWSNPYGNLLGTLGNPNFIGSFFGMFSALLFSYLLAPITSRRIRVFSLLLLPLVFLGIVQSHAVQGKVLFVTGLAIASFYWVWGRFEKITISVAYLSFLGIGFVTALLGTLQKGPLSVVLYKETVSLRGEYWFSGWKTGLANPFFGAGFDSLGDWYRRSRRESALTLPGVDTVINAAHNVYMDMFAFGGWPLFVSYVLIVFTVLLSIVKFTIRNTKYDPVFVSLVSVWLCYQLQSTISINQVGLAVWGWAFGAAIIAYEINDSRHVKNVAQVEVSKGRTSKLVQHRSSNAIFSPGLTAGIASVVGLLIVAPPFSADTKWRSAQVSQNAELLESSLEPGYLNPLNSFKIANNVSLFESSGLHELAHKYAILGVEWNPDNFEAWKTLYQIKLSTTTEKLRAEKNMKRLDPLNPDVRVVHR